MSVATEDLTFVDECADDVPVDCSEKLKTAPVPEAVIERVEDDLRASVMHYRKYFRTYDDAEFFCMLPLDKQGKETVLQKLLIK